MVYSRKFTGRGRSRSPSKCQDVDLESGTRTGRDLDLRRISSWSGSRSVKTVNFGVGHLRTFWQTILNNLNRSAERKLVVKCGHVARSHADAAEAGRPANYFLFVSSVNVNAALESVGVRRFQSAQPNNARHHRIAAGSIRLQNLAGPATIMEDGSKRRAVADFLRDLQQSKRSGETAPRIAQAISRGRNRIRRYNCSVLDQHQLLVPHTDDNSGGKSWGRDRIGRKRQSAQNQGNDEGGGTKHPPSSTPKTRFVTRELERASGK